MKHLYSFFLFLISSFLYCQNFGEAITKINNSYNGSRNFAYKISYKYYSSENNGNLMDSYEGVYI